MSELARFWAADTWLHTWLAGRARGRWATARGRWIQAVLEDSPRDFSKPLLILLTSKDNVKYDITATSTSSRFGIQKCCATSSLDGPTHKSNKNITRLARDKPTAAKHTIPIRSWRRILRPT